MVVVQRPTATEPVAADRGVAVKLVVFGAPRTKKTSGRIVGSGPKCHACGCRTGRPFLLPSEENVAWTKEAVKQMRQQLAGAAALMIPVNCRALFYRERNTGDLVNYEQALADALEEAGIVENDRLIVSWDNSRLLKDAANPRIEILLSPVDDAAYSALRTWRPRAAQAALPLPAPDDAAPIR